MAQRAKQGPYRGRIVIGRDDNGKEISRYVTAATRKELEQKKAELRQHYIDGVPLKSDMPFYQYAEEWYRLKKEPFLSAASRQSYRSCFISHILPEFGMRHMRAISASQLQSFVNEFAGSSKSQITQVITILRGVLQSAYADGILDRDPTAALVRPRAGAKQEKRALTDEETQRILETIHSHPHGLFLAVLYYLGLRRGEALGLQWSDIDFRENQVHVQRDIDYCGSIATDGELKTRNAERYVPLPEELRKMLLCQRGRPEMYIFHTNDMKPWPQASYRRIWTSLMHDAGCTEEREIDENTRRPGDILKRFKPTLTPHYFRHNYVTMLYEAGVDPLIAMKIVGHADYQTTANIYTHLSAETTKKAQVSMEKVFRQRVGEA